MTTKFQEVGEVKNWTNDTGVAVVSGQVVKLSATGVYVGVAITDIAIAAVGAVKVTGVFNAMPKTTGSAWVIGSPLNWDVSTSKWDLASATPATGDVVKCGIAWEAAASGDTTGVVELIKNASATVT